MLFLVWNHLWYFLLWNQFQGLCFLVIPWRYKILSDTLGEDIAETESKESSDYDSDEDDYDSMDSFINDSDPEKLTSSPEPKKKTKGMHAGMRRYKM